MKNKYLNWASRLLTLSFLTFAVSTVSLAATPPDCDPDGNCGVGPTFTDITVTGEGQSGPITNSLYVDQGNIVINAGNLSAQNGTVLTNILNILSAICLGPEGTQSCSDDDSNKDSVLAINAAGQLEWLSKDQLTSETYWIREDDGTLHYDGGNVGVGTGDSTNAEKFFVVGDIKATGEICNGRDECIGPGGVTPGSTPWLTNSTGIYYNAAGKNIAIGALPITGKKLYVSGDAQVSSQYGILVSDPSPGGEISALITADDPDSGGTYTRDGGKVGVPGVYYDHDSNSLILSMLGKSESAPKPSGTLGAGGPDLDFITNRTGGANGNQLYPGILASLDANGHFRTQSSVDTPDYYLGGYRFLSKGNLRLGLTLPTLSPSYLADNDLMHFMVSAGPSFFTGTDAPKNADGDGLPGFGVLFRNLKPDSAAGIPNGAQSTFISMPDSPGGWDETIEFGMLTANGTSTAGRTLGYFNSEGVFTVGEAISSEVYTIPYNGVNHAFYTSQGSIMIPSPPDPNVKKLMPMITAGPAFLNNFKQPAGYGGNKKAGGYGLFYQNDPGNSESLIVSIPDSINSNKPKAILFQRIGAGATDTLAGPTMASLDEYGNFNVAGKITANSVGTYADFSASQTLGKKVSDGSISFSVACNPDYVLISCRAKVDSDNQYTTNIFAYPNTGGGNSCTIEAARSSDAANDAEVTGYARCLNPKI